MSALKQPNDVCRITAIATAASSQKSTVLEKSSLRKSTSPGVDAAAVLFGTMICGPPLMIG